MIWKMQFVKVLRIDMIAIDTNILVRIITNDGPKQANKAVELLSKAD